MLLNFRRAQDYLGRYDLKALVATSATNVSYLTGYDCWQFRGFRENMTVPGAPNTLAQSYGVISADKRMLITSAYMAPFPIEEGVEVRAYGDSEGNIPAGMRGKLADLRSIRKILTKQRASPAEALAGSLRELAISSGRVGVEYKEMSEHTKQTLKRQFPRVEFKDATELIRFIRMVKTQEEVARMKKAAKASEEGLSESLGRANERSSLGSMRKIFLTTLAENGAFLEHWTYSPDGLGLTDNGNVKLRRNMFTFFDVGCIYNLYYSDTGTTLVVGQLDDVVKTYRTLFEIVDDCLDALRPGATPSTILSTFSKAYGQRGIKNVNYQGHGIGLETREHPVIAYSKFKTIGDEVVSESIQIPLEEGMVINIETPLDVPGEGGYQVERTFLIRKRSVEEVTPKRDGWPYIIAKR